MKAIEQRYFTWLCFIVDDDRHRWSNYRNLLMALYSTDYIPLHAMDTNRAKDGIELRYRFGVERDIADDIISSEIDRRKCSILEMMLALAVKIEDQIMYDSSEGEQVSRWFWEMIRSLGLEKQTDDHYEPELTYSVVQTLQRGEYDEHGNGGLFPLSSPSVDVRSLELWDQMNRYIVERYF